MSGARLLNHLADVRNDARCRQVAERIKAACNTALKNGQKTSDLGGNWTPLSLPRR